MTIASDSLAAVASGRVTCALPVTVHPKVAWIAFPAGPRARLPLDADPVLAGAGLRAVTRPVARVAHAGVWEGAAPTSWVTAVAAAEGGQTQEVKRRACLSSELPWCVHMQNISISRIFV